MRAGCARASLPQAAALTRAPGQHAEPRALLLVHWGEPGTGEAVWTLGHSRGQRGGHAAACSSASPNDFARDLRARHRALIRGRWGAQWETRRRYEARMGWVLKLVGYYGCVLVVDRARRAAATASAARSPLGRAAAEPDSVHAHSSGPSRPATRGPQRGEHADSQVAGPLVVDPLPVQAHGVGVWCVGAGPGGRARTKFLFAPFARSSLPSSRRRWTQAWDSRCTSSCRRTR